MELAANLWEIIVNIIEALLFIYLLTQTLYIKVNKKAYVVIGVIIRILWITFLNFVIGNSTISLFLLWIYDILFTILFFGNSITEKLLRGSNYILIAVIGDKITFWVANTFTRFDLKELVITGKIRIIMTIVYLLACMMLVSVFIHFQKGRHYFPLHLRIIFLTLIGCGVIASDLLLNLIIIADQFNIATDYVAKLEIVNGIFLFLLICFVIFMEYAGLVLEQNENLNRKNVFHELEKKHYEAIGNTMSILNAWKHDNKTYLEVIYSLAKGHKYSELISYIEKLDDDIQKVPRIVTTGNTVLDALLSVKLMEMKNANITFHHEIYLTEKLPFDEIEFSSLIGNILNNAIYSCKEIPSVENRGINFIIKPHQDMLYICSENNSLGNYRYNKRGELVSTKPFGQGIGIKTVKEIVRNAEGFCNVYPQNDKFKIIIMIPLPTGR